MPIYDIASGPDDWFIQQIGAGKPTKTDNTTTLEATINNFFFPSLLATSHGDIDTISIPITDIISAATLWIFLHNYIATRGTSRLYNVQIKTANEFSYINIATNVTYISAGWKSFVLTAPQYAEIDKGGKTEIKITTPDPGAFNSRFLETRAYEYPTTDTYDMYLDITHGPAVDEVIIQKSLIYKILSSPSVTKSLKYAIKSAQSITKVLSYAIRATQAITKPLAYKIKSSNTLNKSLGYLIKSSQSIIKSLIYKIKADKLINKVLQYKVKTSTKIEKQLDYVIKVIESGKPGIVLDTKQRPVIIQNKKGPVILNTDKQKTVIGSNLTEPSVVSSKPSKSVIINKDKKTRLDTNNNTSVLATKENKNILTSLNSPNVVKSNKDNATIIGTKKSKTII